MNYFIRFSSYLMLSLLVLGTQDTSAEEVTYFFNDLNGSPVQAFDQNGNEKWGEQYTPYGQKLIKAPANKNDIGFTGHQSDDDIGLTYMQARYYDAEIGRFYSIDPVDFRLRNLQSFNRYAYANNNPYKFVDPDGQIPVDTVWDAVNIVYDVGKIAYGYASNNPTMVTQGGKDLAADTAALFVPYLPAGSTKLARAAASGKGSKSVNGNSKSSTKAQHGYEIVDTKTGKVAKTGVSGQKLNKNGTSKRANAQANKWNKEKGNEGRYKPRVVKQEPAGKGAREKILKWEKGNAKKLEDQLDPKRHVRP